MTTTTTTTAAVNTISVPQLKHALKIIEPAVGKKSRIDALRHVRIEAGRITATNMEATISCPLPGTFHVDDMCVPFDDLKRIASALKVKDRIEFLETHNGDGSFFTVVSSRGETMIPVGSIEDWPMVSLGGMLANISFGDAQADALDSILATSVAIGRVEARPVLCSMLFEERDGRIRIATTDSYRMAVDSLAFDGDFPDDMRLCVPRVGDILKNMSGIDNLRVYDNGSARTFVVFIDKSTGITAHIRTVDGTYPNVDQLVPNVFESVVRIPDGLADSVLFAGKAAGANSGIPARLAFDASDNTVEVSLCRRGGPKHSQKIMLGEREMLDGSITIGLNSDFLVSGIRFVQRANNSEHCPDGRLSLISPLRPIVLDGGTRTFLLMPVRLSS